MDIALWFFAIILGVSCMGWWSFLLMAVIVLIMGFWKGDIDDWTKRHIGDPLEKFLFMSVEERKERRRKRK